MSTPRKMTLAARERLLVGLLFATSLLVIAAQTATKTARDALFLSHFSISQLCYVMLAMAVLAAVGIVIFERLSRHAQRNRVILALYSVIACSLVAFSLSLHTPHLRALYWGLYLWSGLFSLMMLAEYWLLANAIFDVREAKRFFGILAGGAILGGIVGGFTSAWLVHVGGTRLLLQLSAAEIFVAGLLSHVAWRFRHAERPLHKHVVSERDYRFGLFWRDRYIRLLGLLTFCLVVAITLAEWQYKAIVQMTYGSRTNDMAAFFGLVAGVVNSVVFVLQTLFSGRIIHRFGAPGALRFLPVASGIGAVCVAATLVLPIAPLLPAAAAVMLTDGLRFSIDKSAFELFYMPIDRAVRDHARHFIDVFVDRFGGAVAALVWLALSVTVRIGRPHRVAYVSFAVLFFVTIWLWQTARARSGYVRAYRMLVVGDDTQPVEKSQALATWVKAQLETLPVPPRQRTQRLREIGHEQLMVNAVGLPFSLVAPYLEQEIHYAKRLQHALLALVCERDHWPSLLLRSVEYSFVRSYERIARLLALVYSPRDIRSTHHALRGKSRRLRAAAIELVDAVVDDEIRKDLVNILEHIAFGSEKKVHEEPVVTLDYLLADPDPSLRAAAAAAAVQFPALRENLRVMSLTDESVVAQDAARLALANHPTVANAALRVASAIESIKN